MNIQEKKEPHEENKIKLEKISAYIKEHLQVVTIISVFLSLVFNFCSYVYSMGIYDFWNIPHTYISSNAINILYRFILFIAIGMIIFIISTLVVFIIKEEPEQKKRVVKILFCCVTVILAIFIIYFILLWRRISFATACQYIGDNKVLILVQCFWIGVLFAFCGWGMGSLGYQLIFPDKRILIREMNHKGRILTYGMYVVTVIGLGAWMLYTIYECGLQSAESEKKISIATIQEREYVVVNRYDDVWIIKECIDDGTDWKIAQSHYEFRNLEGIPLQVRTIDDSDSLKNHLIDTEREYISNSVEEEQVGEIRKPSFVMWCNQNQGFISAILTVVALFLSILTMTMTYKLGRMPYKKKLRFIPTLYNKGEELYMDIVIINAGNATVCINNLTISNSDMLNIGMAEEMGLITLKPCDYINKTIRLYDDLENIEKRRLDLNGYIFITAYDVDGKKYMANRGFGVG